MVYEYVCNEWPPAVLHLMDGPEYGPTCCFVSGFTAMGTDWHGRWVFHRAVRNIAGAFNYRNTLTRGLNGDVRTFEPLWFMVWGCSPRETDYRGFPRALRGRDHHSRSIRMRFMEFIEMSNEGEWHVHAA